MLDKLHIKKEKLVDIQSAMKTGDLNNDGVVDFEEWRHNMKQLKYFRNFKLNKFLIITCFIS